MSTETVTASQPLGPFARYLTLWVALCIMAGIVLGHLVPGVFHLIGAARSRASICR